MENRLLRFEKNLLKNGLDGFLVTGQNNIYYLTGFLGSAGTVFISKAHRILITDARYTLIAKQTVRGFDVIEAKDSLEKLVELIAASNLKKIGFDSQVSFAFYQHLATVFAGYDLEAQTGFVEGLRIVKDQNELAAIQKACRISDQAFIDVLDFIKPGKTDQEVADFIDSRMKELGGQKPSFETISVSGHRSAMPHGTPSAKLIEAGDALTLDFGTYYDYYVSDMTRTVFVGHATEEQEEVYQTVLQANQAVLEAVKSGMTYKDYDKTARAIIEQAGYGRYFTHSIGHGIGLDVHEAPFFRQNDSRILEAGMVITDEPGIYLEDQFGVRIEDDLLVTEAGCQLLTHAPKGLIII